MEEKLRFAAENCRVADGRGFEPRVPFGTHAFQACTIDRSVTHPLERRSRNSRNSRTFSESKLQSSEQFVERQLNADIKFTEVRVLGAHRIETHFANTRL